MDLVSKMNLLIGKGYSGRIIKGISRFIWLEKLYFYELDIVEWVQPKVLNMRVNAHFSFGTENDIETLCTDPNLDAIHEKNYYTQKMRSGHLLLLAIHDDEIIFYLWVVSKQKKIMNKILMLNEGEIAIERGFTRKEYRGHGLFVYGFFYLMEQSRSLGLKKCYTEIALHNTPMISTAKRCGFKEISSYYYWLKLPFRNFVFPKGCLLKRIVKIPN